MHRLMNELGTVVYSKHKYSLNLITDLIYIFLDHFNIIAIFPNKYFVYVSVKLCTCCHIIRPVIRAVTANGFPLTLATAFLTLEMY